MEKIPVVRGHPFTTPVPVKLFFKKQLWVAHVKTDFLFDLAHDGLALILAFVHVTRDPGEPERRHGALDQKDIPSRSIRAPTEECINFPSLVLPSFGCAMDRSETDLGYIAIQEYRLKAIDFFFETEVVGDRIQDVDRLAADRIRSPPR